MYVYVYFLSQDVSFKVIDQSAAFVRVGEYTISENQDRSSQGHV